MDAIRIDFSNLKAMCEVMDKYHATDTMLVGESDNGERTLTSIFEDHIVHVTYQNNGWVRMNVLHRDGEIEEIFDGKWK
jgi:rhamnose utilization protein RhaD (predicted bifunctional aldolase and dehydrogenase)